MSLQILPNAAAVKADASARIFLEFLIERQERLRLSNAFVFYNFPLFREDEQLLVADFVIVSPQHGTFLVSTPSVSSTKASEQLEGAFSQIFARLVKYPRLRSGRASLKVALDAFIWLPEGQPIAGTLVGLTSIETFFREHSLNEPIAEDTFEELMSVLDGSKALIRPKERATEGFAPTSRVAIISRLEEEIRKFDRDQRVAYMTDIVSPQRVQGLAGSGKTVVLAIKAALTSIKDPDARIAVTFYTKSLYQHIKRLITRFYRMHEDRDPDWRKIQVLHGWGGATTEGLYYYAARRLGHEPLNFSQASMISRKQPFAAACSRLLSDSSIRPMFDYILVDEAQDFPTEFMQLVRKLVSDDKFVIAYDIFQTIFDVAPPTSASLFGTDDRGNASVVFDEDIVLHKCYRNPREILVCAHAIGLGIYGNKIVQMLETKEHWDDFGYQVRGELIENGEAVIARPAENSPSSISESNSIDQIIEVRTFDRPSQEVSFVANKIRDEISNDGVPPEDILVVSADDRNASAYMSSLASALSQLGVETNNLHDQSYRLRDFQKDGAVTLSTVHKAKGNEAYSVYLVGIDALFYAPTPRSRNCAFTGMTRAKGWLCVTGVGNAAAAFASEVASAKAHFPELRFTFPGAEEIVFMKRDLMMSDPEEVDEEISKLGADLDPDEFERLLRRKLREVQARNKKKRMR